MPSSLSKLHILSWLDGLTDEVLLVVKKGKTSQSSSEKAVDLVVKKRKQEDVLISFIKKLDYSLGESYNEKLSTMKREMKNYEAFLKDEVLPSIERIAVMASGVRNVVKKRQEKVRTAFEKNCASIKEASDDKNKSVKKALKKLFKREKERIEEELDDLRKKNTKKLKSFTKEQCETLTRKGKRIPIAHVSSTLPRSFDDFVAVSYKLMNARVYETFSEALMKKD